MPYKFKCYSTYSITCIVNSKVYIGATKVYKKRVSDHLYLLKKGKHLNFELQADFNKYGDKAFQFDKLDEFKNEVEAFRAEKYIISNILMLNREVCYNVFKGGGRYFKYTIIGKKSLLSVCKTSDSLRGRKISEPHRQRVIKSLVGRKHSELTKKKISDAQSGDNCVNSKKVIDTATGKIYGSLKQAAACMKINYSTSVAMLAGRFKNKSTLQWH